ncbi:probable chitinase 10 [Topomyia yanbarensis]|uniref:probable chitinase 10 n=1 Tax=Topomyia yanbarensis TaxID=2498891 RepID=UPI00273CA186|nr:probable chitinase 10 [Topomyia yanbarensis]
MVKLLITFLSVLGVISLESRSTHAVEVPCESSGSSIELQSVDNDCQKFIVCVLNVGTEISCPNETYFDIRTQKCGTDNSQCDPKHCHPACKHITEKVAHEDDCTKYVQCNADCTGETETCPAGLHFNPFLEVCDSPNFAECMMQICSHNVVNDWAIVASVNSCQTYYLCFGTYVSPQHCAADTFFDPEKGRCELISAENSCEMNRPPSPPNSVIEQCQPNTELLYIPYPDDASIYFRCLNGNLMVLQCPDGLIFDFVNQVCSLPIDKSIEIY